MYRVYVIDIALRKFFPTLSILFWNTKQETVSVFRFIGVGDFRRLSNTATGALVSLTWHSAFTESDREEDSAQCSGKYHRSSISTGSQYWCVHYLR